MPQALFLLCGPSTGLSQPFSLVSLFSPQRNGHPPLHGTTVFLSPNSLKHPYTCRAMSPNHTDPSSNLPINFLGVPSDLTSIELCWGDQESPRPPPSLPLNSSLQILEGILKVHPKVPLGRSEEIGTEIGNVRVWFFPEATLKNSAQACGFLREGGQIPLVGRWASDTGWRPASQFSPGSILRKIPEKNRNSHVRILLFQEQGRPCSHINQLSRSIG